MTYYTYQHITKDTGRVFYVGKGKNRRAWSVTRSTAWQNIYKTHGRIVKILNRFENEFDAYSDEIIQAFAAKNAGARLVNDMQMFGWTTPINVGRIDKEESKLKRSIAMTGRPSPLKGRKIGPVPAISLALKGVPKSDEHCKKLSMARKAYLQRIKETE